MRFTLSGTWGYLINHSTGGKYASWTFRKAPGFFDVVTWTGDASSNRQISHSLGSVPGMIVVKSTDATKEWSVYHRSQGATKYGYLNDAGFNASSAWWANTEPTSTHFTIDFGARVNQVNVNYVAYVFAHDDASFGKAGDESIIKCGSYAGNGSSGQIIDFGFEPQWVMIKCSTRGGTGYGWTLFDMMRDRVLFAEENGSESGVVDYFPSPNGIHLTVGDSNVNESGESYIYMAIRRPHKPPEAATEVFSPYTYQDATLTLGSGTTSTRVILNGGVNGGTNFPVDMFMGVNRTGNHPYGLHIFDRLRGKGKGLLTNTTGAEPTGDSASNGGFAFQEGIDAEYNGQLYYLNNNAGGRTHIGYFLKRAGGFFDIVAYTGTGSAHNEEHNLGVTPEMLIIKPRNLAANWTVWHKDLVEVTEAPHLRLNSNLQKLENDSYYDQSSISSTVFNVGTSNTTNGSSYNYIAYLFATLPGISKVGSYTGTGNAINVDCGFTAGARFILIKRTDSTGDWYYWDSARGIIAGNDPYQLMNSTAAEVTNTDYVDPLASGFTVTSTAPAALNASGGTYIFLAIA